VISWQRLVSHEFTHKNIRLMKKTKIKIKKKIKRIPVPKKPPKVEKNPKAYDRKKNKRNLRKNLKEVLPSYE
jgi:hypothetical protein